MKRWRTLLIVIPAAVPTLMGVFIALLLKVDWLTNYVYMGNYYVDLAWLVSFAGLGLSIVCIIIGLSIGLFIWSPRQIQQLRSEIQAEARKDRERFINRIDHEVKNPLAIIRLSLSNLQHSPNLSEEESSSLLRASQQLHRLQKLIADLRWLTELNSRTTERQRVELREVVQDAVYSACPEEFRSRIQVHYQEVPWPVGTVLGDRDLLVTSLRNLLDNALKFTEESDQIELRVSDDGYAVTLEVADSGIGIPAHELPYIFEELYRGQNVKRITGSGMGLALVHRIISLHYGTISVRSREGHGTVMTIRLPLARAS